MFHVVKYLIISVALIQSQAAGKEEDCNCEIPYFAEGSAHSSQFLQPDGSLITNSKGSSITSDGIQQTFHELKKEADKFISKSDQYNADLLTPHLEPVQNVPSSMKHFSDFQSGTEQKSFSQSGNAAHLISRQYQPVIPETSKVSSVIQEQTKTQKDFINTKNVAVYPSSNNELEIEQHKGINSNANANPYVYHSSTPNAQQEYEINQNQGSRSFQMSKTDTIPIIQKIQYFPDVSSGSSFSSSSSYGKQKHSLFIPDIKPNTFTAGVIEMDSLIPNFIPSNRNIVQSTDSPHYSETDETKTNENTFMSTNQKEYKLNATPIKKILSDDINQINTDEYIQKPNSILQQYKKNQNEASQTIVQTTKNDEFPTSRLIVKVKVPGTAAETFERSSSMSSHSQTMTSDQSQLLDTGIESQQLVNEGKIHNVPEATYSFKKETSSSSRNSSVIRSPTPLSMISHNAHYNNAERLVNGKTQYGTGSFIIQNAVPHPFPQNVNIANAKSSSSNFFTSNGQVNSERLVPNSELLIQQMDPNPFQSGSSSFEKLMNLNSNSNSNSALCNPCIVNLSSSNIPIKNSYGISTSFSSSSSNINGKKSENRQASVSVNDNGKVDTYNVHS